jgi:hypothetical protein
MAPDTDPRVAPEASAAVSATSAVMTPRFERRAGAQRERSAVGCRLLHVGLHDDAR